MNTKRRRSQVLQRPCLAAHPRQKEGSQPWHCMGIVALFVCPVLQTARGFVQLSVSQRPNNRMLSEHHTSRLMKDIWLPTGKGQAPEQATRAHKDRLFKSRLCSTGHPPVLWLTLFIFSFLHLQAPHLLIWQWKSGLFPFLVLFGKKTIENVCFGLLVKALVCWLEGCEFKSWCQGRTQPAGRMWLYMHLESV